MNRSKRVGLGLFLLLAACEALVTESETAYTSLDLVVTEEANLLAVDQGRIRIVGPTNRVVTIAPGATDTIQGLEPGTYTIAFEGLSSGEVATFDERSGIQVIAGRNTTVPISLRSFVPVLQSLSSTLEVNEDLIVPFTGVSGATDYRVEVANNPAFSGGPVTTPTGGETTASVSFPSAGTYYVRVRAINSYGATGQASASESVIVVDSPTLVVNPSALTFTGDVDGPDPADQTLSISNGGGGTLTWSVSDDADWLTLVPTSGTDDGDVTVSVETTGLSIGDHSATITVTGSASNSPVTVPVTFTVTEAPVLVMTCSPLTFNAVEGGSNPQSQTFSISNGGTGTLNWSVDKDEDASWLTLNPTSGSSTGETSPVTVGVNTAGLSSGTYPATITATAASPATGSPQTCQVTLNVITGPIIEPDPTSLEFTGLVGGPNPEPQTLTITNTGSGALNWSVSDNVNWLTLAPTSGTSTGEADNVTVSVNISSLGAGTHHASITVSGDASNSPGSIPVTLTLTNPPELVRSPVAMTFSAMEGGPNPSSQTLSISNGGDGTLSWSVSDNQGWLTLSPTSGTSTGETDQVTVSANIGGLPAGVYSALITASGAPPATGSPKTTVVTLTVTPGPRIGVSPSSLTFSGDVGGADPANQTLTISNTGGGTLSWDVDENVGWMSLSPTSGTNSGSVTVDVNTTGMSAGTYNANVTVTGNASNSPVTVPITLNLGTTAASVSITSITYNPGSGHVPVDPQNVFGEVRVNLNVQEGENSLDRVDISIGGELVATRDLSSGFTNPVQVTVFTNQVKVGSSPGPPEGDLYVPVVFNGNASLSADLFEQGGGSPEASDSEAVRMNNPDVLLPGTLDFYPSDGTFSVQVGPNTWYQAGGQLSGPQYLAFSRNIPTDIIWPNSGTAQCTPGGSVGGSPDFGISLGYIYDCWGLEGSLTLEFGNTPAYTPASPPPGPDGTPTTYPTGFFSLGAQFFLNGVGTRWSLATGPGEAARTLYFDNKGPTVTVGTVAYNENYDEYWVNSAYSLSNDVMAADGGTGVDGSSLLTLLWTGSCNGSVVNSGADLSQSVSSSAYRICGMAMDLLGNLGTSGPSNWFGVDKTSPVIRIHGTGADPISGSVPSLDPGLNDPDNIFSISSPAGASWVWGIEALDNRSGFNLSSGATGPVLQTLTRWHPGSPGGDAYNSPATFLKQVLSDSYVRTTLPNGSPYEWGFLGSLSSGTPGQYLYEATVTDRAGNTASLSRNWYLDEAQGPFASALTLAQLQYTPGAPGTFNLFGGDDLEVEAVQVSFVHPTDLGHDGSVEFVELVFPPTSVDPGGSPWDLSFPFSSLNPYSVSSGLGIYGRVDFTASGGSLPGSFNTIDTDGDSGTQDDDFLPVQANGRVFSDMAGNGPSGVVGSSFVGYDFGGWTDSTAEPWSFRDIITWTISDLGGSLGLTQMANSSTFVPAFDYVLVLLEYGGEFTICGAATYDGDTDNGVNRFFNFLYGYPSSGTCSNPPAGSTFFGAGVIGEAMLVTYPGVGN